MAITTFFAASDSGVLFHGLLRKATIDQAAALTMPDRVRRIMPSPTLVAMVASAMVGFAIATKCVPGPLGPADFADGILFGLAPGTIAYFISKGLGRTAPGRTRLWNAVPNALLRFQARSQRWLEDSNEGDPQWLEEVERKGRG